MRKHPSKASKVFCHAIAASLAISLCGCASLFGVVRSVDDARAWAESKARKLSSTIQARTPLPPRSRPFLVGTWKTTTKIWSVNSRTPGDENWMEMDLTYHLNDGGTFTCDDVSASKIGEMRSANIRSSTTGTWTYANGVLHMHSMIPRVGVVNQRFNVLWYGDDEFELREDDESFQEARARLEKSLQTMATTTLRSFGNRCSDSGVTAQWCETSGRITGRLITGSVALPSIMRRSAGEPRTAAAPASHPAPVAAAQNQVNTTQPAKWRRVGKTDLGENRVSIVYELSDDVSIEEADRTLLPVVCDEQKEAFLRSNPDVDPGSVHATADYETRNGRRTLVYTASAFTTQPTLLEMHYSGQSRRGSASYRIHAYGNIDAAYDFVRRNIGSLVSGENVVLEAGKAPPPGAKYRLENQLFQDGVLTVEFESLE